MTLAPIFIALSVGAPLLEIEGPRWDWLSEKMEAQCGAFQAGIEFKDTFDAKRPLLKGYVKLIDGSKRTLKKQLQAIRGEISSVSEVGILCESESVLLILVNANALSGRVQYKIYVNDRLEVTVFSK